MNKPSFILKKHIILQLFAILFLFSGLITASYLVRRTQDLRSKAEISAFDPKTVPITEHGVILQHGQTYFDLWQKQINHPPVDNSIEAWAFYPNGDQIVIKGNSYWFLTKNSTSWTAGNLQSKWSACSNFPSDGVDAYTIHPGTGNEYAMKGIYLFSINSTASACIHDRVNWRDVWAEDASDSGEHPLLNYSKIDQMQWVDNFNQVVLVDDKIYMYVGDESINCYNGRPSELWHFCEPETLSDRWVKFENYENHPPTTHIDIFTVSQNPYYHIYGYSNYLWTLGKDQIWDTFNSGMDGYGAREAFITKFEGDDKYYLYYDASSAYKNWKTAYATANHPLGPWTKQGEVNYLGTKRSWENVCSAAASIFKIGSFYYNFYLGAPIYFGSGINAERYRICGFDNSSDLSYYNMGLSRSTNPGGPFNRLRGDGTTTTSSLSDNPLIYPISDWHAGKGASAQGTLLPSEKGILPVSELLNVEFIYTYTTQDPVSDHFAVGMASANNILGPWSDTFDPLIYPQAQSENAGVFYHKESGYYFMFVNAVSHPPHDSLDRWERYWQQCGNPNSGLTTEGVALIMYWTKDIQNWEWDTNYRVLASSQGENYVQAGEEINTVPLGCNGNSNFIPESTLSFHKGNVGLGFPVFVENENKLYVAFDGSDFGGEYNNKLKNHMFRDIYLLSFSLPTPTPTNLPVPSNTSTPVVTVTSTTTPIPTTVPTVKVLPGDSDGDGDVDEEDYGKWLLYYDPVSVQEGGASIGDFNGDTKVDGIDYTIWLNNYTG